ncbi:MAG: hypothetical protein LBS73_05700 [Campylobacteraceae bacterium]|jgi:hypothetical protein|nr:hypothetical protein [Campylobacteraceae bacterium]
MSSTKSTKGYLKRQLGKSLFFKAAFFVLATCFIFNADLQAQTFGGSDNNRTFKIKSKDNIKGDIVIFGNTILGEGGVCATEDKNNNFIDSITYFNKVPGLSTFSSSSSKLILPTGSTIVKAYIYWQGRATVGGVNNNYDKARKIKLKTPKGVYDLSANGTEVNWKKQPKSIPYQATKDITEYVRDGGAGDYAVGDLFTDTGGGVTTTESGAYGGWAIVVVYENSAESLKNITIYDGYDYIDYKMPVTFAFDGFLTPTSGPVDSKFVIFAGEGDVSFELDDIRVNNVTLRRSDSTDGEYSQMAGQVVPNVLRSMIYANHTHITTREPFCKNNMGIDIQTFNIGTTAEPNQTLIGNGNTSVEIYMNTYNDVFYPSVFALSTQLYEPDVCYYIDTIKDGNVNVFEDGKFIAPLSKNKDYQFNIWISNMRKNPTDPIADADKVEVSMEFKKPNDFGYVDETTWIRNVGLSPRLAAPDATGLGLGDHVNTTSIWRVGVGANTTDGGTLHPAANFNDDSAKAFVEFNGSLGNLNGTNFNLMSFLDFKASFETPHLNVTKNAPIAIRQCANLTTNFTISISPVGNFTVVNQGFDGTKLDVQNHTPDNALYTQIANKRFDAVLVSLGDYVSGSTSEKEVVPFKVDDNNVTYKVYAIPSLDCSLGINGTCGEAERAAKCKNATAFGGTVAEGNFSLTNNGKIKLNNIFITTVSKRASLKIVIDDDNETASCSIDNFAIRPNTFVFLDTNYNVKLTGGLQYNNGSVKAIDAINATTIDYNQAAGAITHNHSKFDPLPTGCLINENVTSELIVGNTNFTNGIGNITVRYNNIGKVKIGFEDQDWSKVDENEGDCIPDSISNDHNSTTGRLGCYIGASKTIEFIPARFGNNTLSIRNFKPNFTYIVDNHNMTAFMDLRFTALLADNTTATNYHQYCYAKDINYTIALINDTPDSWQSPHVNITNAKEQIRFHLNATNSTNATVGVEFGAPSIDFYNGTANASIRFGFAKNQYQTQNPFRVVNEDFNITIVKDTDDTRGEDFNRSIYSEATFYYGRVKCSQDTYTATTPPDKITTPINYEVWCGTTCNAAYHGIDPSKKSPVERNWYINTQHGDVDFGNITNYLLTSVGKITPDHPATNNLINGSENNTFTNVVGHYPLTDAMTMETQNWLYYRDRKDRSCFLHYPGSGGGWAGEGNVNATSAIGRVINTNASNVSNSIKPKIDW